jgi:serine/threonine protein kinase
MADAKETGSFAPPAGEPGDDPRVLELAKEYQAELDRGRRPDRAEYLARHPDLAAVLPAYLDGLDLLHRGAKDLSGPRPVRLDTGLAPGSRIGEFEVVREVGRGGMGVVYEAVQPSLNRRVALKVLPAALAADRTRLSRFTVEAQAAAAVAHPHIVPVYAVGEDRGLNYYAMRLIDGVPLDSLAAGLTLLGGAPDPDETRPAHLPGGDDPVTPAGLLDLARWDRRGYHRAVARLGSQVARALDHAHQSGVVHRDVKPANLMLGRDGHVWVTDFGLAQLGDGPSVTRTGAAVGTARYMSPEQAAGDRRRLDHRTDVYSLAVTLYELLTGRPAFPSDEPLTLLRQIAHDDPPAPRSVDPAIPADLETVLLKAMQKDPRDRYPTAAEFADDLDRFLAGRPVLARRPGRWDRAKKWAGRHPAAVAAALVSLLVVVAAAGVTAAVTRQAYKAERDRADEAERRFRQAKGLGDAMLRISEEEIGSGGPFQPARYRLLQAALHNYEELRAAGHGDPQVREQLDQMLDRVRNLLAQQAAAREIEPAYLLVWHDVQDDLGLSDEQIDRIERLEGFAAQRRPGKGPPEWRLADPGLRKELIEVLTPPQRVRLRQLFFQSRGLFAFNEPEVVDELRLTSVQRQQIRMIQTEAFTGFGPGPPGGGPGKLFGGPGKGPGGPKGLGGPLDGRPGGPRGPEQEAKAMAAAMQQKILGVLDPEQRARWQALVGKPAAFSPFR